MPKQPGILTEDLYQGDLGMSFEEAYRKEKKAVKEAWYTGGAKKRYSLVWHNKYYYAHVLINHNRHEYNIIYGNRDPKYGWSKGIIDEEVYLLRDEFMAFLKHHHIPLDKGWHPYQRPTY